MRDVRAYLIEPHPVLYQRIDRTQVIADRDAEKIPVWYPLVLANRQYIFPVFLTVYLCFLFVKQTQLFDLQYSMPYLAMEEHILLLFTLVSGACLIWKESLDDTYTKDVSNILLFRLYLLLAVVLGVM